MGKTKRPIKADPVKRIEEASPGVFIITGLAGKSSYAGYTRRLAIKKYKAQYQKQLRKERGRQLYDSD